MGNTLRWIFTRLVGAWGFGGCRIDFKPGNGEWFRLEYGWTTSGEMDKVLANPLDCALLMFIFGSILHYFTLTSRVDLRKDIPCFWCLLLVPAPTFDPCISISFSLVLAPWDRAFGMWVYQNKLLTLTPQIFYVCKPFLVYMVSFIGPRSPYQFNESLIRHLYRFNQSSYAHGRVQTGQATNKND